MGTAFRQGNRHRRLILPAAAFLGLGAAGLLLRADPPDPVCLNGGTTLRWESFGFPFFETNCGQCHDWTNYAAVYGIRFWILDLVQAGRMPASGGLPQKDRDDLAEWIACDMPREEPRCPSGGTALSWDNFARGFFAARCGGCHAKDLAGPDRYGAPLDQNWDDLDSVLKYAPRILDQVLKGQMPPGGWVASAEQEGLREWIACGASRLSSGALYQRGDPDEDGETTLADAVSIIDQLFEGGSLRCLDSADSDGSGVLDLTDAVYLIWYLYLAGQSPPEPFGHCGGTLQLGCAEYGGCPAQP